MSNETIEIENCVDSTRVVVITRMLVNPVVPDPETKDTTDAAK